MSLLSSSKCIYSIKFLRDFKHYSVLETVIVKCCKGIIDNYDNKNINQF